jgi:hypothetical protein
MRMRTAILATAAVVFGIWQTTALAAEAGVAPAAAPDCRAAISWLLEGGLLPLQSTALPSTRSQNAITPLDYDDCRAFCEDELTSCMENCGGPFCRSQCFSQYRNCEINCYNF